MQQRFFVVKYGVREVLNLIEIDTIDFLLSFAAVLFTRASEAKLSFEPGTLNRIAKWIAFAKGQAPELQELDAGRDRQQKAYRFFQCVLTILVREISLRQVVHQSVQRNLSELVEMINLIIDQLPSGMELLVIIDDLEKIPDVQRAGRPAVQSSRHLHGYATLRDHLHPANCALLFAHLQADRQYVQQALFSAQYSRTGARQ